LLLFAQAMCDLALPDFMSDIVNEGISRGDTAFIMRTGAIMLIVSLAGAVCSVSVGYISAKVAAALGRRLRSSVFKKVAEFSNAEFDKFTTSSLITRTTNDITQIQTMMVFMIRLIFYAPIMAVGGLLHAVETDQGMSWIIVLAIGVLICVISFVLFVAIPKFKAIQALVDKLNLVVRESLDGMLVIRAFNTQRFEEKRFDGVNGELTGVNLFINRVMSAMMPTMMLIMNLVTVLIIWVGSKQVSSFKLDVGNMMAYMQYVMQIMMAFLMISMMFIFIPRASVSANRIAEILQAKVSVKDAAAPAAEYKRRRMSFPHAKREDTESAPAKREDAESAPAKREDPRERGVLQFHNVSFAYPGADDMALRGISFIAKPGETTAFIGSTGSGKSTLVNLIPRFYDVVSGSITIDGVDIREISLRELRGKLGFVPQKSILFSGSVKSNISYAGENISDDEIWRAAEISQSRDFIDARSEGLESDISQGGSNVSGGQRQRLSIARAIAANAQYYIFDDSFSALDFKTDAALRHALKKYMSGSTVITVTQRVSSAMKADQIIVLDHGLIAGAGTHDELIDSCPLYKEIALSQLSMEDMSHG
jgi:ATP-binding cassette subfamily B protein